MEFCDICDCAHVPNALRRSCCSPKCWARGWKCSRCHGSCVHFPDKLWLHCGWVCEACRRIPEDWRNHDDRRRMRWRLIQRFPKLCVIVRDLAGNDFLRDNGDDKPKQFSPVQKIEDVVEHLRFRLRMWSWEKNMVCKDVEVLKQATWLGILADATGQVHLSAVVDEFQPSTLHA